MKALIIIQLICGTGALINTLLFRPKTKEHYTIIALSIALILSCVFNLIK